MTVEFQYDIKKKRVKIVSDDLESIREAFSAKNPAKRFSNNSYIPSRLYAITAAGYCLIGLVPEIIKHLQALNIPLQIEYSEDYKKVTKDAGVNGPIRELGSEMKLRPYQREVITEATSKGFGTVIVGTGGGKTFIMATLINNLNTQLGKVLVVVPDVGLVEQTYDGFIESGIPKEFITKWSGSNDIDLNKNIIIANMPIMQRSKPGALDWFKFVKVLIVDECHKLRVGNKINKIIDKIPTYNRFGFTGTLPEDNIDKWNIIGHLGPVIYEKTTSELRDEGKGEYITNAQAIALQITYKNRPEYEDVAPVGRYKIELEFIYNNEYRNKILKNITLKIKNNCLILVDHIDHGTKVYETLKQIEDKQVYFIRGSTAVEDRKIIQNLMEVNDDVIVVAISKIFSTGISIKNIHYIVFAALGKSKIKTLQSIGRGLRTNANKSVLTIIDIVDNLIYGKKHFKKRKEYYALEKIGIHTKKITEK